MQGVRCAGNRGIFLEIKGDFLVPLYCLLKSDSGKPDIFCTDRLIHVDKDITCKDSL